MTGKECKIVDEMQKYEIQVLGISEIKEKRNGEFTVEITVRFILVSTRRAEVNNKRVEILME